MTTTIFDVRSCRFNGAAKVGDDLRADATTSMVYDVVFSCALAPHEQVIHFPIQRHNLLAIENKGTVSTRLSAINDERLVRPNQLEVYLHRVEHVRKLTRWVGRIQTMQLLYDANEKSDARAPISFRTERFEDAVCNKFCSHTRRTLVNALSIIDGL